MTTQTFVVVNRWLSYLFGSLQIMVSIVAVGSVHAADFFCAGADAACLIAAINEANTNGQENTISLDSGEYVTEPINVNGPFSLTIMGQGGGNNDYPSPLWHSA